MFSCDETEFLKETPLDFYAPENSFVSVENFNSAVYNLYSTYRNSFYSASDAYSPPRIFFAATDLVFHSHDFGDFPNFSSVFVPTNSFIYTAVWQRCYRIIYDANTIIGRVDGDQSKLTDIQKSEIKAEALFFRAFMYKMLADLYGGVPIVLEETTEPKRDYTRATRKEVYEQCVLDLTFAAENLKNITEVNDARISDLVAFHVLSEVYISIQEWEKAINAATRVINDPATGLMTERFGSRVNDVMNPNIPWASGGDVYWDLFRKGNQNRSSGNIEALWVLQYEYNTPGGGDGGTLFEAMFNSRLWTADIYNNDGRKVKIVSGPNTYYGGRASGFHRLTHYFYNELWEKSGFNEDIRNSEYSIIRDLKVNNPASNHNGKWIFKDNLPIVLENFTDTMRNFYPLIAKISSMGDHPRDIWLDNQSIEGSISSAVGPSMRTFRDVYQIRLAETYLLRAEAFLGNNQQTQAAEDINVIRNRANVSNVEASQVNIDYILDERMRELYLEEFRLLTLTRLGKLVDRAKKYHPFGNTYAEHNNLWPIPYNEIEKNIEGFLEQNPGY